jgi:hypothetical protein
MTTVLTLALIAAGLALIVGARETAKKIGFAVLAVIVGWLIAQYFLCWLSEAWTPSDEPSSNLAWFWSAVALSLIAIGGIAWKTRAFRQRRLEDLRRRQMHPRRLAPLPPPNASPEYDEDIV